MTLRESFPTRYVDRFVGVDVGVDHLIMARGEYAVTRYSDVWDVRAPASMPDPLKRGTFTLTNLRAVWNSEAAPTSCNLTVGYNTITRISVGNVSSPDQTSGDNATGDGRHAPSARSLVERPLIAPGRTIVIHCSEAEKKYRFEFRPPATESSPGAPSAPSAGTTFFDIFQAVYRAYDTTRMYRKLRLRSSIRAEGKLSTLDRETVQIVYDKVSLLGSMIAGAAQGSLALTSHRIIWYSSTSDSLNLSLPYVDCSGLLLKDQPLNKAKVKMLVLSAPLNDSEKDNASALGSDVKGAGKNSRFQPRKQKMVNFAFTTPGDEARIVTISEDVLARIRAGKQEPDYGVVIDVRGDEEADLRTSATVLGGEADAKVYVEAGPQKAAPALSKPLQAILSRVDRLCTYLATGATSSEGVASGSGDLLGDSPEIEYNPELGLAFEAPPQGVTVAELWGW